MGAVTRPVVRFGRQRGQCPDAGSNDSSKEDDVIEGIFLPAGADLRQITIIPKAEWQRIQDSITAPAREAARIRAERKARKDLHLKSEALVKNWTNTIAGMSQMKLKAKQVRKEKKEEERRKIDLEEAKYSQEKRKEMIEQAKLVQHYESERVKGFHRAFLLTEVLKERDAQIEFKKIKQNLYRSKDEQIERERQKAIVLEEEKAKERHAKRMQLNRDQLEQIKEHEHLAELNRLEEKREGEEIKAMTRLYEMEIKKKEEEDREKKLRRRQAHQEHVADQITLKAIEKQKQQEEDDKIQRHLKAKKAMDKLKKAKQEELNRLMEEERDRITKRLLAQMKQKLDDEDERIARAVAEAEEERERDLKAKEEKNKADLKSITEHRIGVIKKKEEQEKQEKLEAQETLRGLMEADRIYQELEKDKKHRFHCANLKLQESHVMQIAEKIGREERAKQEEIEYEKQKQLLALYKEQEFQNYAKKVIDEESKTTPHIYPLVKAVKDGLVGFCRPGYRDEVQEGERQATKLPYLGETAQEMKLLNEHQYDHTKARLGFTW